METLQILKQLLNGNHLNESELKEAEQTVNRLKMEIESRKPKHIEFTRVNNDVNGNPRYVCHYLDLLTDEEALTYGKNCYTLAVNRAKEIGGKKYRGKDYGGGIVFQSYNITYTKNQIKKLLK